MHFQMLFLLRSDPLVSESPFFMVEVDDSPAESPKCVHTQIKHGAESSYSKQENRTIRFCRLRQQLGAMPESTRELFLWPSDIWMTDMEEP
jgi:hypothetical protein